MRLFELISTSTYPYEKVVPDSLNPIEVKYVFNADDIIYEVDFEKKPSRRGPAPIFEISFKTVNEDDMFKNKKHIFKIFGTIEKIIYEFLDEVNPKILMWRSTDSRRRQIYDRFSHPYYERYVGKTWLIGGLVRK